MVPSSTLFSSILFPHPLLKQNAKINYKKKILQPYWIIDLPIPFSFPLLPTSDSSGEASSIYNQIPERQRQQIVAWARRSRLNNWMRKKTSSPLTNGKGSGARASTPAHWSKLGPSCFFSSSVFFVFVFINFCFIVDVLISCGLSASNNFFVYC